MTNDKKIKFKTWYGETVEVPKYVSLNESSLLKEKSQDKKIFLIKCKREEIINRPTIDFIELIPDLEEKITEEIAGEGDIGNRLITRRIIRQVFQKLKEPVK